VPPKGLMVSPRKIRGGSGGLSQGLSASAMERDTWTLVWRPQTTLATPAQHSPSGTPRGWGVSHSGLTCAFFNNFLARSKLSAAEGARLPSRRTGGARRT